MEETFEIDLLLNKEWWERDMPPLGSVTTETIEYNKTFEDIGLVQVTDCSSYDDIWICSLPWYPRDDLLEEMNHFYVNEQGSKWKIPSIKYCPEGKLLAATYKTFGYHRVIVEEILTDDIVRVFYLDYGTTQNICVDELRLLHKKFLSLDVQAVPAKLWGFQNKTGDNMKDPLHLASALGSRNKFGMLAIDMNSKFDRHKPSLLLAINEETSLNFETLLSDTSEILGKWRGKPVQPEDTKNKIEVVRPKLSGGKCFVTSEENNPSDRNGFLDGFEENDKTEGQCTASVDKKITIIDVESDDEDDDDEMDDIKSNVSPLTNNTTTKEPSPSHGGHVIQVSRPQLENPLVSVCKSSIRAMEEGEAFNKNPHHDEVVNNLFPELSLQPPITVTRPKLWKNEPFSEVKKNEKLIQDVKVSRPKLYNSRPSSAKSRPGDQDSLLSMSADSGLESDGNALSESSRSGKRLCNETIREVKVSRPKLYSSCNREGGQVKDVLIPGSPSSVSAESGLASDDQTLSDLNDSAESLKARTCSFLLLGKTECDQMVEELQKKTNICKFLWKVKY